VSAPGVRRIDEPGESEFSHGKGLRASDRQRSQYVDPIDPEGPWAPSVYEQGKSIQRTNPADPSAVADPSFAASPGTPSNYNGDQWVRES
jgi:hypothetical protein